MSAANPHRPVNDTEWNAIQENAKSKALQAVSAGSPHGLTSLERAYYQVLKAKRSHQ